MNVDDVLVGAGVGGAVDVDGTAVQGATRLGLGDVAVLGVAESDEVAGGSGEGGEAVNLLADGLLVADVGVGGTDTVGNLKIVKPRATASPLGGEASGADEGSVGGDAVGLLNPGVAGGQVGGRREEGEQGKGKDDGRQHCD